MVFQVAPLSEFINSRKHLADPEPMALATGFDFQTIRPSSTKNQRLPLRKILFHDPTLARSKTPLLQAAIKA